MPREITKYGVIVIDDEELRAEDVIEIMRGRDQYAIWKRDGDKRGVCPVAVCSGLVL